jgi:ureidoglycolate lyase
LCLFRSQPFTGENFSVTLLEKHPGSTQVFIPMGGATRFLVVVALGGDEPDLATLRAFVAGGSQGITYRPGVWHHPIIALDRVTDFFSLVFEDASADDCMTWQPARPIEVSGHPALHRA